MSCSVIAMPHVAEAFAAARQGDQKAWVRLVEQYTPLIRSITGRYRLSREDADDVSQFVWLRLHQNLDQLREPLALPGWITTTTRNEVFRVSAAARRTSPVDPASALWIENGTVGAAPEANILRAESDRLVSESLSVLSAPQRRLMLLLHAEPPMSYAQIGRQLGIATGSIGPTRARCLAKLRAASRLRRYANG